MDKILVVLDGSTEGDVDFSLLNRFGKVVYYDNTSPLEVEERVKDANIIITNKVELNEQNLKNAKNIEIICETGMGYNNIDVEYAKKANIAVTNVSGYSTPTVAQHTFAMLLNLYDKISYFDNYIKSGNYSESGMFTHLSVSFNDLEGKVWGIVGLGAIGNRVAKIAEAFGAEVVYYSTSGRNNNSNYKRVELDTLLSESDVISIHAPLNEKTKGLFNYQNISKMKKTAFLVNVGRGPIIVNEDLAKAIDNGIIAGAALDVFDNEPLPISDPLLSIENKDKIVMTPHIAWASKEARDRLFKSVIMNIEAFYKGEKLNRVDS